MILAALLAVAPALEGVPSVSTRYSLGHVCPITSTRALTAAHVIDPRPFDPEAPLPLLRMRWTDQLGNAGQASGLYVIGESDLGVVSGTFPVTFPIAKVAPKQGESVFMAMYGWRMKFETLRAKIVRELGGMLVFDKNSEGGSSGGCVLNESGEVVGIVAWGIPDEAGMAVSVVGFDMAAHDELAGTSPPAEPRP